MHLTMCTMADTPVSSLEGTFTIERNSCEQNGQIITDNDDINDSGNSDDLELINTDRRDSSATFIIDTDQRWDDVIDSNERERLAREHCDVGDEDELTDDELHCYTSHIPMDDNCEILGESPYSNDHFGAPVPTPIELGIKDILNEDMDHIQDIKQKKYQVLPSIGKKKFEEPKQEVEIADDSDPTINQLDYTREKMETEADFFADYRVNTSVVKPTPRNVPLPPIGQTFTPRSMSRESS